MDGCCGGGCVKFGTLKSYDLHIVCYLQVTKLCDLGNDDSVILVG